MARSSDTRERVRAIANNLANSGQLVSSRKVRQMLGAGSLSTITDELAKWEAERASGGALAEGSPSPLKRPQIAPDHKANAPMPILQEDALANLTALLQTMAVDVAKLSVELSLVREELISSRQAHDEQLAIAYQRYEAVQRHAMTQIDDARQVAAELRQKLNVVSMDTQTREDAQRGKAQALREENVRLVAKIEFMEEHYSPNGAR
jgi:hypothetical protein